MAEKNKNKNNTHVILASSSNTRIKIMNSLFEKVEVIKHKINETKERRKRNDLNPKELAKYLAIIKAKSVSDKCKDGYIIGCDQTLECNQKIINKPRNYKQAKDNLLFLTGKKHKLHTCLYVLKNTTEFFIDETTSQLFFKKISEKKIDEYLVENKETALSCVGSYKIEDNKKYNFIKVIRGNKESIIGFPIMKFIKKLQKEKK